MDIERLKEHILNNNLIPIILDAVGCHHITEKSNYYSAANPDGDNPTAIIVYKNEYLTAINYTRDILNGRSFSSDIFTLIEYIKQYSFFETLKWVCQEIGIDYYTDFDNDLPQSIKITNELLAALQGNELLEHEKPLAPISEKILSYYLPCVNDYFLKDGVSYNTQLMFEMGYDPFSNRITIPIRDEIGTLVGVKGRLFKDKIQDGENKYSYLEPCARSQILYGLDKSYDFIKCKRQCYVVEAEKGVMQLWNMGYYNCVSTGGKNISKCQIEKLTRLCADIVFVFDKDVEIKELFNIADRFVDGVKLYALVDQTGTILPEKYSPTDKPEYFEELKKNIVLLK